VLTDSLFQAAGATKEKERETSEIEANGWCRRWAEGDWSVLDGKSL